MELRSTEETYIASVSLVYAEDQIIAPRRQNAAAEAGRARSRSSCGLCLPNPFPIAIFGKMAPKKSMVTH
jgi:hypothetical protein